MGARNAGTEREGEEGDGAGSALASAATRALRLRLASARARAAGRARSVRAARTRPKGRDGMGRHSALVHATASAGTGCGGKAGRPAGDGGVHEQVRVCSEGATRSKS